MVEIQDSTQALVSVIIPCFNHGMYLPVAIESVISQSYPGYELIVIDDGSTDDTATVCLQYPFLKYIYQSNAGLSSARNAGVANSEGEYLVFLDADDWLLKDALEVNLQHLILNREAAFVSGAFELFYEPKDEHWAMQTPVADNHYLHLLRGNYIGMHATVMYRRWVFNKFSFDPARRLCEDYDMYLKITRQFQVIHHTHVIAVYRQHRNNMSADNSAMLDAAIDVLLSQEKLLTTFAEKEALSFGLKNWKRYYSEKLYNSMIESLYNGSGQLRHFDKQALKSHGRLLFNKLQAAEKQAFKSQFMQGLKSFVKQALTPFINNVPAIGNINLGDLERTMPFSTAFGYDRGGPVDRYFIERFLADNASRIRGRVLEIGDNEYTMRFGDTRVDKSDILHVDASNSKATIIGDLAELPQLADDSFDCIILTQTLQLVYNYKAAIETCFRILKAGGALLITVPGISQIASDQWSERWCWSFTAYSITKILQEFFVEDQIRVDTYGNVLLATAFLYGMGIGEIKEEELEFNDPHYQLIISGLAIK
jgi:glycosyltransferase involved in cell wall biosynthesis